MIRRLSDSIRRAFAWLLCRLGLKRPTVVVLIRHADVVPGADPSLSATGATRAAELVHLLGDAGVLAIFTSEFRRTQQTAKPLADHLGLIPQQRTSSQTASLAAEIIEDHSGQTVLVVGHSNTVPQIAAALGAPWPDTIEATEFDHLLWVTIPCRGRKTVHHLRYGATT